MLIAWDQYIKTAHSKCVMFKNSPQFMQDEWAAGIFRTRETWKPAALVRVPQFNQDGTNATVRYIKYIESNHIAAYWNGQLCYFCFLDLADAIQFDLTFRDDPAYQSR